MGDIRGAFLGDQPMAGVLSGALANAQASRIGQESRHFSPFGVVTVPRAASAPEVTPATGGIGLRHETISAPGVWESKGSAVFSIPYLKLAQVLLLAGSLAIREGVAGGVVGTAEIDTYLDGIYSGRVATEQVVTEALTARARNAGQGWRRHTMLMVGFSVLSASVTALRNGMVSKDCSLCDGLNCQRPGPVGIAGGGNPGGVAH